VETVWVDLIIGKNMQEEVPESTKRAILQSEKAPAEYHTEHDLTTDVASYDKLHQELCAEHAVLVPSKGEQAHLEVQV
jgi:hypothetical protein